MKKLLTVIVGLTFSVCCLAQISVNIDRPKFPVQPTMWGLFFEDINFAGDGGLYAEMIKNRSFEFYEPLMGWHEEGRTRRHGQIQIMNRDDNSPSNPRYARLKLDGNQVVLTNEGFRGMGLKEGLRYDFSMLARLLDGNVNIKLQLLNSKEEVIGETGIMVKGNDWTSQKTSLQSKVTELKGKFRMIFTGNGIIEFDMVSLFPSDTWKNRPGGLRADLVQLLADIQPGFLRFPGGCIVEGFDLSVRYQWKKTIGNIEDREMIVNRWNTEFSHRLTPDYYQSFGLGFYEYFLLSEDIGAEPLPILNCGMACQFNTGELVPMSQIDPYVQDALDLIEFANGPTSSKWGKIRAEMGHIEPFNMKYIGIGNEQWGPQYIERYLVFEKAIKAKYPDILIVSGSGPFPDDSDFHFAWGELVKTKTEIIDEHYYHSPEWFLSNATRYDNYDRKGPKVFAGEYAAQSVAIASPHNKNNWRCALAEAAFMTGLERNADVVHLTSYAPLFAHVDGWQWTPDMIWFDNLNAFGTANYYVQKLYANNKGTHGIDILAGNKPLTGQDGLYASAVIDQKNKQVIIKMVNATDKAKTETIGLDTKRKLNNKGSHTVLRSDDLEGMNSINEPKKIHPLESEIVLKGKSITANMAPYSVNVIKISFR